MSLWNPFTFGVGGDNALLGAAPAALRFIGGAATERQLAAARMVFARFCALVRTSPVPNPTEFGTLPDGSAYRISAVGSSMFMEVWVRSQSAPSSLAGIGVSLDDGVSLILRSSGSAYAPWRRQVVNEINGGFGYSSSGRNWLTASMTDICRGNARMREVPFGVARNDLFYPGVSLFRSVSNPYVQGDSGGGQFSITTTDSPTLTRARWATKDSAVVIDSVAVSGPGDMSCISTASTGSQVMVNGFTTFGDKAWFFGPSVMQRSAITFAGAGTAMTVISTADVVADVAIRWPLGGAEQAPKYSRWTDERDEGSETSVVLRPNPLWGINPNASEFVSYDRYFTRKRRVYNEASEFELTTGYRSYIDQGDRIRHDKLKIGNRLHISVNTNSDIGGYDGTLYADYRRNNKINVEVSAERLAEIEFDGFVKPVRILDLQANKTVSGDQSASVITNFDHYVYGSQGQVISLYSQTDITIATSPVHTVGDVDIGVRRVLLCDAHMEALVYLTVKVEKEFTQTQGYLGAGASSSPNMSDEELARFNSAYDFAMNRGDPDMSYWQYVNEATDVERFSIQLTICHGGGERTIDLPGVEALRDDVSSALGMFAANLSNTAGRTDPEQYGLPEGVNENKLIAEVPLLEAMEEHVDKWLGAVQYAKEPVTGFGLLSIIWREVPLNFIVGPTNVVDAGTVTSVGNSSRISYLVSV